MTDEERRAKARAKDARKRARRRARKLGLPAPEFPGVSKGGRPPVYPEGRLSTKEYQRRRRRLRGIPSREGQRLYRECMAEIAKAERLAARLSPEEAREQRAEQQRRQARRYRALYPDRKREQDRRYRQENRKKVVAAALVRKERARISGKLAEYSRRYALKNAEKIREYGRVHNLRVTAAHKYLVSIGLLPWFGPRETTVARRAAALAFVREAGLLDALNPPGNALSPPQKEVFPDG